MAPFGKNCEDTFLRVAPVSASEMYPIAGQVIWTKSSRMMKEASDSESSRGEGNILVVYDDAKLPSEKFSNNPSFSKGALNVPRVCKSFFFLVASHETSPSSYRTGVALLNRMPRKIKV